MSAFTPNSTDNYFLGRKKKTVDSEVFGLSRLTGTLDTLNPTHLHCILYCIGLSGPNVRGGYLKTGTNETKLSDYIPLKMRYFDRHFYQKRLTCGKLNITVGFSRCSLGASGSNIITNTAYSIKNQIKSYLFLWLTNTQFLQAIFLNKKCVPRPQTDKLFSQSACICVVLACLTSRC